MVSDAHGHQWWLSNSRSGCRQVRSVFIFSYGGDGGGLNLPAVLPNERRERLIGHTLRISLFECDPFHVIRFHFRKATRPAILALAVALAVAIKTNGKNRIVKG